MVGLAGLTLLMLFLIDSLACESVVDPKAPVAQVASAPAFRRRKVPFGTEKSYSKGEPDKISKDQKIGGHSKKHHYGKTHSSAHHRQSTHKGDLGHKRKIKLRTKHADEGSTPGLVRKKARRQIVSEETNQNGGLLGIKGFISNVPLVGRLFGKRDQVGSINAEQGGESSFVTDQSEGSPLVTGINGDATFATDQNVPQDLPDYQSNPQNVAGESERTPSGGFLGINGLLSRVPGISSLFSKRVQKASSGLSYSPDDDGSADTDDDDDDYAKDDDDDDYGNDDDNDDYANDDDNDDYANDNDYDYANDNDDDYANDSNDDYADEDDDDANADDGNDDYTDDNDDYADDGNDDCVDDDNGDCANGDSVRYANGDNAHNAVGQLFGNATSKPKLQNETGLGFANTSRIPPVELNATTNSSAKESSLKGVGAPQVDNADSNSSSQENQSPGTKNNQTDSQGNNIGQDNLERRSGGPRGSRKEHS